MELFRTFYEKWKISTKKYILQIFHLQHSLTDNRTERKTRHFEKSLIYYIEVSVIKSWLFLCSDGCVYVCYTYVWRILFLDKDQLGFHWLPNKDKARGVWFPEWYIPPHWACKPWIWKLKWHKTQIMIVLCPGLRKFWCFRKIVRWGQKVQNLLFFNFFPGKGIRVNFYPESKKIKIIFLSSFHLSWGGVENSIGHG